MYAPRSIQINYCILFSILYFLFTLSIVLIHAHESPFSLYFILFYFPFFVPLFTLRHSSFASTLRLHATPTFWLELIVWPPDEHLLLHASTPTRLLPLDTGLPNAFPHIMDGVETWATYDLIGKSWARTRYMRGSPCNTLSLSSVLDDHWGGELWSTSSIFISLITL